MERLKEELRARLGPRGFLEDAAARLVYARDASHLTLGRPLAVALPADAAETAAVVAACARAGVPLVCRGAGTGLSGGAVPPEGALVLGLGRLRDLGPVDEAAGRMTAAAGALNEDVSRRARPRGLHFAPDPSSQAASTIGGNIAENAGGPHCLRHGVTLQHLRRLDWLDAAGRAWRTGHGTAAWRGLDLTSLLCGSEGTLGVVTAAELVLTPDPRSEVTLLAEFPRLADATAAVGALLGAGLLPVAVEMVDRCMLGAVEEAFAFGFATDVDAVMIAEFAGGPEETVEDGERARTLLRSAGARAVRLAADDRERARLWTCRKKAFGAVGRLAPSYVTMDVVVPLGSLTPLVADIAGITAEFGVQVATAFHAGDGNLHPGVHFDERDPDLSRRAHAAADAIIERALALGGSATGEHGVGIEKRHVLPRQLDREAARLMAGIKAAFDPGGLLNPGKALAEPGACRREPPPVPDAVEFRWPDLTVTVPGDADLGAVQAAALERGLWIPVGSLRAPDSGGPGLGTLPAAATAIDQLLCGPTLVGGISLRDALLEVWAEDGRGTLFHAGAPVFKNVAGYDLQHFLAGTGGILAVVRAATFKLAPAPERFVGRTWCGETASAWPALAELLASRGNGPGAPTLVRDAARLHVMAGGRDRAWDLGDWLADLDRAANAAGLEQVAAVAGPFAEAASLATGLELPDWALAAPDWTVLTAADGGPATPPPGDRWVRQASPQLLWVPRALPVAGTLAADVVWTGGDPAPLPTPAVGVPRPLLQGLKTLFDPDHRLPTPAWLAAAGKAER